MQAKTLHPKVLFTAAALAASAQITLIPYASNAAELTAQTSGPAKTKALSLPPQLTGPLTSTSLPNISLRSDPNFDVRQAPLPNPGSMGLMISPLNRELFLKDGQLREEEQRRVGLSYTPKDITLHGQPPTISLDMIKGGGGFKMTLPVGGTAQRRKGPQGPT